MDGKRSRRQRGMTVSRTLIQLSPYGVFPKLAHTRINRTRPFGERKTTFADAGGNVDCLHKEIERPTATRCQQAWRKALSAICVAQDFRVHDPLSADLVARQVAAFSSLCRWQPADRVKTSYCSLIHL